MRLGNGLLGLWTAIHVAAVSTATLTLSPSIAATA